MMNILAVSGSLRRGSSNTAIVAAAAQVSDDTVVVRVFGGLAELPPFNPDLERESIPTAVAVWREALRASSGVLISSPEYAHGVPGVLKNALDWVVGSGELMGMPVALVNASAASSFVTAQLRETLTVMMAEVAVATSLPLHGRPSSAADILVQSLATEALHSTLRELVAAARRAAERAA